MSPPAPTGLPTEILNVRQLATYLMVSEKTIRRMLEKRQIPAFRLSAQWRFRRADIDAWLGEQVRQVEQEGMREVADRIDAFEAMKISPLLEPENVWVDLAATSREELIAEMVRRASLDPHVDRGRLVGSILEREQLCSTALLDRVALPHPLVPEEHGFTRKRFLIATLPSPIDFSDLHGHRPQVVCIVLARALQGHLLALSRALKLFGDAELVDRLLAARSPDDVVAEIVRSEAPLASAKRRRHGTSTRPPRRVGGSD